MARPAFEPALTPSGGPGGAAAPTLVGPVLIRGAVTDALIAAISARHSDVRITDRGAYLRVQVPGRCQLLRADVEARLGRRFTLPGDLEEVMPSFQGSMNIGDDEVVWQTVSLPGVRA